MKFFRKYVIFQFLIIFPAVCLLLYNSAVNMHVHQVKGSIISHAHPFSKKADLPAPFANHQHSKLEYIVLDKILNFFVFIICIAGIIELKAHLNSSIKIIIPEFSIQNIYHLSKNLRAPPYRF